MPVVLLWWQDSKVVNYVRLRKCRLVNSIRLDSYPVSQVSSSFRRYGELFPFLLGNHPEMSVFRCVCVCICREKEPFFFQHLFPPNLSNHKRNVVLFVFLFGADRFQTTSIKWQMWGGDSKISEHFPSSQHDADETTHISPLDLPIGCRDANSDPLCEAFFVFFLWLLKNVSIRNPHPALGYIKPTRKKAFTQVDPSSVQLEV